jgi:hypothetical protein
VRSDERIAQTVLDRTTADLRDKEAFDAFHMEMKKKHEPYLPVHFDVVERAADDGGCGKSMLWKISSSAR